MKKFSIAGTKEYQATGETMQFSIFVKSILFLCLLRH